MVDNKSEIDDPNFFFAKDGKTNPSAELNATLDAFFDEKTFDDNASACLFPARKAWLQEQLGIDDLPQVSCKEYDKILQRLSPTSATLVFPSAHINSPASMFGHTFLRINSTYKSKLLAYAINYAADADPDKENGVVFAIKGLFGGYFGQYSLLPYYDKLKEYRDTEKRDIWEYDLNLTQQEVLRMVRHIWELNGTHSFYYFFTENCSYNMLWLMEIARPSVHLREHFTYEVIPLETVHITNAEGLIKSSNYRASKRTILLKYEKLLHKEYIPYITQLVGQKTDAKKLAHSIADNKAITLDQRQYILEAAIEYLEYSYSRNDMKKETYLKRFHTLSSIRATLGKSKALVFEHPQNPLYSHRAAKVSLGGLSRENDYRLLLGIRPAYHSLQDPHYGFLRGTQIEFLNLQVSLKKDDIQVEDFTILSIVSLAQRDKLFHPFSWRTKFGFDRDYLDDKANFIATLGAGFSWGNDVGYLYTMLDPLLYVANKAHGGIGGSIGFAIDKFKRTNTNIELTKRLYDTSDTQLLFSFAQSFNYSQNLQLKAQYLYKDKLLEKQIQKQENFYLLVNYYF